MPSDGRHGVLLLVAPAHRPALRNENARAISRSATIRLDTALPLGRVYHRSAPLARSAAGAAARRHRSLCLGATASDSTGDVSLGFPSGALSPRAALALGVPLKELVSWPSLRAWCPPWTMATIVRCVAVSCPGHAPRGGRRHGREPRRRRPRCTRLGHGSAAAACELSALWACPSDPRRSWCTWLIARAAWGGAAQWWSCGPRRCPGAALQRREPSLSTAKWRRAEQTTGLP